MIVQSGDSQIARNLKTSQISALSGNSELSLSVKPVNKTNVLYMNNKEGILANENVRQAIYLLLDGAGIVQACADGAVLELMQAYLLEGGINLKIELVEVSAGLQKMMTGNYTMFGGSFSGEDVAKSINMLDGRLDPSFSFGGSMSMDETLWALLDKAVAEYDDAARAEVYR